MAIKNHSQAKAAQSKPLLTKQAKDLLIKTGLSLFTLGLLAVFLSPLFYGITTSLKSESQIALVDAPLLYPALPRTYTYEGEEYPIYNVPVKSESGEEKMHQWALVKEK